MEVDELQSTLVILVLASNAGNMAIGLGASTTSPRSANI
jgi:hypothetical protein